jgi:uncharacterized repeat protein (TIGR01451 family)
MHSLSLFKKSRFLTRSQFSWVLILGVIANLFTPLYSGQAIVLAAVAFSADLGVTKTDGMSSVASGAATTYTIRVTNHGPDTATGALLKDVTAAGLQPVSVSCSSAADNQCTVAPDLAG